MKRFKMLGWLVGLMLVAYMFPLAAGAGWTWSNPLPQGNTLNSVWGTSSSDLFALGDYCILHFDGNKWSNMSTYIEIQGELTDVHGSSGSNVFAVGGGIYHYNGNKWVKMSIPGSSGGIRGVWCNTGSDVFAVGLGGNILHFDGTTWSEMTSGYSGNLYDVWGSSGSDVFAVGGDSILHYDGSSWSIMSSGVLNDIKSVWGSSSSDVFVVGGNSILHYDGVTWSNMTTPRGHELLSIYGRSGNDVYAVGWPGTILHFDGIEWSEITTGIYNTLNGVWCSPTTNDMFAVGYFGEILNYNQTHVYRMTSEIYDFLEDVWGSSGSDVYAVGANGAILHYNGSIWYKIYAGTEYLYGIWGSSGSDIFVVGSNGLILHYDGSKWLEMDSGVLSDLRGVWGDSGFNVFAVGNNSTVLHYNGSVWTPMNNITVYDWEPLTDVSGSSGNDVFVVSAYGFIYHYNGSQWSMQYENNIELMGVWCSSSSNAFAVGFMGTVFHYDGNVWSGDSFTSTGTDLLDVWCGSGDEVCAVGRFGSVIHHRDNKWSIMEWNPNYLRGVWGDSNTNVFVVGDGGTILHYDGPSEMNLKHKAMAISDGGNFDFGNTTMETINSKVFTITSVGVGSLTLMLPISIDGFNADQFSIEIYPQSPIKTGDQTVFTVSFNPTSVGPKTAEISIANDDPDENPYNFTVTGTGSQKATMISPPPYTKLTDTVATFNWNDFYADQYWLQIGTALGLGNIYSADQGTGVSAEVSDLPYHGETLFVRLWSKIGGQWLYNDYTYTAFDYTSVWSVIESPSPGSDLTSRDVTFTWSNAGADQYWMQVGTTVGEDDLYSADQGTGTSTFVTGLPHGGETLYVRLWQKAFGEWFHDDYTYTALNDSAAVSNWADGSVLNDDTITFNWNDSGAAQYWLWAGTSPGGKDLYNADQGTGLSAQIGNLPHNGETVYVRLYSFQDGDWIYRDYTYTAVNDAAVITSPVNGSVLNATEATFTWNDVGATQYWLWLGTSVGGKDLYNADQGTGTSATVSDLPFQGELIYARMYSQVAGDWIYNDFQYRAYDYTSALAVITTPANGSTFPSREVIFNWNNSGADQYWLYIGSSLGTDDLYSGDQGTNLSATVPNLPFNGETVYVRLWQKKYGVWYSTDHTYTACNLAAAITSPANGSTLGATSAEFEWNDAEADLYWLYVGTSLGAKNIYSGDQGTNLLATVSGLPYNGETVYVRIYAYLNEKWIFNDHTYTALNLAATVYSPADGSALASTDADFAWDDVGATQYWLWIGSSVGEDDIYTADQGTQISTTVIGLPHNSEPLYVRLWSEINGEWLYSDHTYTACNDGATIATPAPGETLNDTTATFTWDDTDADQYWLVISTTLGGNDVYTGDQGRNLSVTVSGLPHNSETLYVRLYSKMNGEWVYNDHIYTAYNDGATITSPEPDSVLSSSTVTFEWTDAGADQYWLYIGSSLGEDDLFSADQGTSLSADVFALPCDGENLWVRLYSLMNGDWVWNDYSYTACEL